MLLALLGTVSQGQDRKFYAELQFQHRNTDSLPMMQRNFLPEMTRIYANDSIIVQIIEMPFGSMIRREVAGQDSIENYVSFLGNKLLIMSATPDFDEVVRTKATQKKKLIKEFELEVAIGTYKGKEFPIYYVQGKPSGLFSRFKNLAGIPLQYKLGPLEKGLETLVFIKELSRSLPEDFKFTAPQGYERVSKEEINNFASFFK